MGEKPAPILFVAGLGRCGTTMVMTMLDAGGFPVAGPRPAYEVDAMRLSGVDLDWVRGQAGRAVKWIDPLHARISRNSLPQRPVIIHLDRDAKEMGASQAKLLGLSNRNTRRLFERSIEQDRPTLAAILNATGEVYSMTFEWVLSAPRDAAAKLAAIVRHEFGGDFDAEAAAAVPLRRDPRCAPDLSIEGWLLATRGEDRADA